MGTAYMKMAVDAFKHLALNAGVLAKDFNPATGELAPDNLLGLTSGGVKFATNPQFEDFAADIDQANNNMKEFKRKVSDDPTMSGNFVELTSDLIKLLMAGDTSAVTQASNATGKTPYKITPRPALTSADFQDLWWIGDYSDENTGQNAGFLAVHLMNALNTTGFQINAQKNAKAQFAFEWHGHYTNADPDTVPYEIYIKAGGAKTESGGGGSSGGGNASGSGTPA